MSPHSRGGSVETVESAVPLEATMSSDDGKVMHNI